MKTSKEKSVPKIAKNVEIWIVVISIIIKMIKNDYFPYFSIKSYTVGID